MKALFARSAKVFGGITLKGIEPPTCSIRFSKQLKVQSIHMGASVRRRFSYGATYLTSLQKCPVPWVERIVEIDRSVVDDFDYTVLRFSEGTGLLVVEPERNALRWDFVRSNWSVKALHK